MIISLVGKMMLGTVASVALLLGGCVADGEETRLRITSEPASLTAVLGDSIGFSVGVAGTGPYHYTWVLVNRESYDTVGVGVSAIRLRADVEMAEGLLYVFVNNGVEFVSSSAATVRVTFAGRDSLSFGAQDNLEVGSAVDLDFGRVWASAEANANQEKIDLVYLYYNGSPMLNGASAALDSGTRYGVALTAAYDSARLHETDFVKVALMPRTLDAAARAYGFGEKLRATAVVAGDKFVARSTKGVFHYIEFRSLTGMTAGTAKLFFYIGAIPKE